VVFVDPEPRADFLRLKLGDKGYTLVRKDVRDLPGLIDAIKTHSSETVVHTAGLIGGRVQQSLSAAFDINLGGTRNVAEAVRLTGVRRLVHISAHPDQLSGIQIILVAPEDESLLGPPNYWELAETRSSS